MNKILILLVVSFAALVVCEDLTKRSWEHGHHHDQDWKPPCREPCDRKQGPLIISEWQTRREQQEVKDVTVLKCTPESHFQSVVLDARYPLNTTCWGFERAEDWSGAVIYTGVTRRNQKRVDLRGKPTETTVSSTNGNVQRLERARLDECDCRNDLLIAHSDYVLDEPIVGCANERIRSDRLTAVSYDLKIYGECCSECSLHKANIQYQRDINN